MLKFTLVAVVSIMFVANGGPASNSNANAAKPTAAAPTTASLIAFEKQANDAYIRGDGKFFEGFLSDKIVMTEGGRRMGKAEVVKMISGLKCSIKEGWSLTEPQMSKINDDTYVLSYKAAMNGTCTSKGKTENSRALSVRRPSGLEAAKSGRPPFMART